MKDSLGQSPFFRVYTFYTLYKLRYLQRTFFTLLKEP